VLGIGGVRILQALGFNITTFHLNEGHAALLTLDLLRRFDYARVREHCIFTTHTPVDAGHDKFDYDLVEGMLVTPQTLGNSSASAEMTCST
jgi:glycogen phosphorylase